MTESAREPRPAALQPQATADIPATLDTQVEPVFQPLSPRYVACERRTGYVVFGCLTLVGTIFALSAAVAWWSAWATAAIGLLWLVVVAIFIWLAHFWPPIHARHVRWRLGEEGMEIHRGVWWRHQIAIPVARVQHVDVSQGPVQRLFELGTLEIHTAGTKNASVQLEGLQHACALQVRDRLIAQKELLHAS